jgi:MarR family transcriptional regulator, lower aerobic nicotinate degradation pathway regulator
MSASLKILSELIPHLEKYTKDNKQANLEGFIDTLQYKKETEPMMLNNKIQPVSLAEPDKSDVNQIGYFMNYLYRFLKNYTKVALRNFKIATIDDFIFLASLSQIESIRKIDLIKNNFMEIPTGVEIIKRLIKSECINEFADSMDKRSVRLKISTIGLAELERIFKEMNTVGLVLAGNLSRKELANLRVLLEKLFNHHLKNVRTDFSNGLEILL